MKRLLLLGLGTALMAFSLTACNGESNTARTETTVPGGAAAEQREQGMTPAGGTVEHPLTHRRFVLETADGIPFANKEKTPDLQFGEGMRAFGGICNRYTGLAEVNNGMLYIRQMASTKMLCADEDLNRFEGQFGMAMTNGMNMEFDGTTLTLTGQGHTFVFKVRDLVQ